jgi:cellulose biosynthesis protein BcsQ
MPNARPCVISVVSGKGGVGKTRLSFAITRELLTSQRTDSNSPKVVLVDCDLYNHGATLLIDGHYQASHPILSTFRFLGDETPTGDQQERYLQEIKLPETTNMLYFVPINDESTRMAQCSGDDPRFNHNETQLKDLMAKMLERVNESLDGSADFIIFDCHPGPHPLTLACCALSDCILLVSDYEEDCLLATLLTAWHIDDDRISRARLVFNRVSSADLIGDQVASDSLTAIKEYAFNHERFKNMYRGFKNRCQHLKWIISFPDLEEYRIPRQIQNVQLRTLSPFDVRSLGGNGFLLLTKELLRSMNKALQLPRLDTYVFTQDDHTRGQLFDRIKMEYFPTRGLGKTGISNAQFGLSLAYCIALAGFLLLYPRQSMDIGAPSLFRIIFESMMMIFGVTIVGVIIQYIDRSASQFELFAKLNDHLSPLVYSREVHKRYHAGGSPATTTSVWWPRLVWSLAPLLGSIFVTWFWIHFSHEVPLFYSRLFSSAWAFCESRWEQIALSGSVLAVITAVVTCWWREVRKKVIDISKRLAFRFLRDAVFVGHSMRYIIGGMYSLKGNK